nr:MAG TPA: hypothetical protein [Caudoviricetes sp.]
MTDIIVSFFFLIPEFTSVIVSTLVIYVCIRK